MQEAVAMFSLDWGLPHKPSQSHNLAEEAQGGVLICQRGYQTHCF